MNWLAFDVRAYTAALCGCIAAALLATYVTPLAGATPWLAGLLAGGACAVVARDRSGPRGLVVAVMATWTAAIEAVARGAMGERPAVPALLELHDSLEPIDVAAYALGFMLAMALARTSFRRGAGERLAGV